MRISSSYYTFGISNNINQFKVQKVAMKQNIEQENSNKDYERTERLQKSNYSNITNSKANLIDGFKKSFTNRIIDVYA